MCLRKPSRWSGRSFWRVHGFGAGRHVAIQGNGHQRMQALVGLIFRQHLTNCVSRPRPHPRCFVGGWLTSGHMRLDLEGGPGNCLCCPAASGSAGNKRIQPAPLGRSQITRYTTAQTPPIHTRLGPPLRRGPMILMSHLQGGTMMRGAGRPGGVGTRPSAGDGSFGEAVACFTAAQWGRATSRLLRAAGQGWGRRRRSGGAGRTNVVGERIPVLA